MAQTKLFITGGTGFIGGSVLDAIQSTYPELEITALLRKPNESFTSRYPNIKIIKGTFEDFDIIQDASEQADIVLHAGNTDHMESVKAILSGLAKKTTQSLLLHLTGTGSISDTIQGDKSYAGKLNPRVWNDIDDVDEIYNLSTDIIHRDVDKLIADANNDLVKTISISPPDIYGQKTGSGSTGSFLVPEYVKAISEVKKAFYLGEGQNIRGVVHISDVVSLFVFILGRYLQGGEGLDYGKEGFYFALTDGVKWKDAAEAIAKIGHEQGWLTEETQPVSLSLEEFEGLKFKNTFFQDWIILYMWGSNSRAESARAKKLGWEPKGPSFWECLAEDCRVAAEEYARASK
ncbi:hypothetical protein ACHAPT_009767 [Fusarium lateritium]